MLVLWEIKPTLGGVEGGGGGGGIISQSRVFMPFSQLVKLFGRVSRIFINLV